MMFGMSRKEYQIYVKTWKPKFALLPVVISHPSKNGDESHIGKWIWLEFYEVRQSDFYRNLNYNRKII